MANTQTIVGLLMNEKHAMNVDGEHSILEKLRRKTPKDYINFIARYFENAAISFVKHSEQPQIFITGLPRSGTTLVYQYLVHRLQVAYLTNGLSYLPNAPAITSILQHRFSKKYSSNFESHYGFSDGFNAPHEGGNVWPQYFHIDNYVAFDEIDTAKAKKLAQTIYTIQVGFRNLPFVNKDVKHQLRLEALAKIFNESYFIILEREIESVALSLLRARLKRPASDWFSVRPPNYESIKDKPLIEQIALQVWHLREQLNKDISRISQERIIRLDYETFCKMPDSLIIKLENYVGIIPKRNDPILKFDSSFNIPNTDQERQLIDILRAL